MVPSCSWKTISGWTNFSGKVTSHKMSENEMGNRGSKSVIFNNIAVKEQRVDGSWCINRLMHLRCTLVNFERNSWAKIPSKQFNIKNYSTFNTTTSINPWVLSGLIAGEGSFTIIIDRNKTRKFTTSSQGIGKAKWFFFEWLFGLTDGEGSFYTKRT